jgi:hypothetical protein
MFRGKNAIKYIVSRLLCLSGIRCYNKALMYLRLDIRSPHQKSDGVPANFLTLINQVTMNPR